MLPVVLPEMIGGKYRPRDVLGTGASGTVYSVEHLVTGELLALKVMKSHLGTSNDGIARFKREARAVSQIKSPHVVRIFDADLAPELGGVPYLVMDLLDGCDLERLASDQPVPAATVVEWLRQVARALDKAHRIGIVHRDLKPENLFLARREDGGPLVKILDFGIAKITAESTGTTQCGQLFGTPLYMAPEQARGEPAQIGPPTDLYAMGLIAYRFLTGSAYRTGSSLTAILNEIIHEPLRAPSELYPQLGPEFDVWFFRACHPEPAQRFRSAHEEVEALARVFGLQVGADTLPPPSSVRPARVANVEPVPTPQPDSSGNTAIISVRGTPPHGPAAYEHEQGGGPMPGPGALDGGRANAGPGIRGRRRTALLIGAVVAAPLVGLLLSSGARQAIGLEQRPVACPVDSNVALLSGATNGPPATAPLADPRAARQSGAPEPVREPAPVLIPTAPPERDIAPPRTAVTPRAAPARAAASRARASVDDDPLSDQQ